MILQADKFTQNSYCSYIIKTLKPCLFWWSPKRDGFICKRLGCKIVYVSGESTLILYSQWPSWFKGPGDLSTCQREILPCPHGAGCQFTLTMLEMPSSCLLHHLGHLTENDESVDPVLLYLTDPNTVPGTCWAFQSLYQVNRYVGKTNGGWGEKDKKWKEEFQNRYDLPVANKLVWQNINSERPQRKTPVGPSQVTASVLNLSSKSISSFMNRGRREKAAPSHTSFPRRI